MILHVRLEVAKLQIWITVYMCVGKKGMININFKFSGEGKGGQNNKVFETLRNKNWVFL